jgi:phosphoglycolate phosphatase
MNKQIKGVIFDKDGTLFDFDTTWGDWTDSLICGLTEDNSMRIAMGDACGYNFITKKFVAGSIVVTSTYEEINEAWINANPKLTNDDIKRCIAKLDCAALALAPVCDLPTVLSDLRQRGYKLGVATNDSEASALTQLKRAGVTDFFDFIVGYDSGHGAKPDPGMLLAFGDRVGLSMSEIAMVGDSTHDLIAGRAAGAYCVGVLTGPATRADIADHADVVLDDISHLLLHLTS